VPPPSANCPLSGSFPSLLLCHLRRATLLPHGATTSEGQGGYEPGIGNANPNASGPSPGRRPPPGCGFPKEQAVKVLGTGRARRNCARGPPANPKGRVLWLTTSTLPGISIDEPCLQRPSELRPPSPGFRPDARPPPGCGFPKELAAEANTYPTQAFTREPDSIRQQFLEEANRKILGAGWTRERVSTWSSGKFRKVGFCGSPPPPGLGLPSTSRASTPF
jgi:hypothetical protein